MNHVATSSAAIGHEARCKELHDRFSVSARLLNRELSWLNFNYRVLEEALDQDVPLLERLKFLAIFASNLDEFFMVRVAFVRRQIDAGITKRGPEGWRPEELIEEIVARVHEAHENIGRCYRNSLLPALAAHGVTVVTDETATAEQREFVRHHYNTNLHPLITPLALDPTHPFLHMETGALYFCIELHSLGPPRNKKSTPRLVLLRLPTNAVSRFVQLPSTDGMTPVMMIDDVIRLSLGELFPDEEIRGCYETKIVRDSELDLDDVGSVDLLKSIEEGLERRKKGAATRFLYDPVTPAHILERFVRQLKLSRRQMFLGARYHSFADMMQLPSIIRRPDLQYEPMPPLTIRVLEDAHALVDVIRSRDILLHHPYQSFSYVNRFFEEAANDPKTVAIKSTLYRVSNESHVATSLARAARNGKQVTVLVELKARFDEERNIAWARTLEAAGAHVIYGVKKLKTHCKMSLVVRTEGNELRRYCHLSTGNYNDRTARMYSDIGLLTAHPEITADVANVFNRITGDAHVREYTRLIVAPEFYRKKFVKRIRREADHARAGHPSGIIAKMNALVDPQVIDELYLASLAGVPISLIVRGICCLRPGVPGLSENIEVISIIDRFLEHARIYRFENGGSPELFLASGDWMPRNLDGRIEVAYPILDPAVQSQVNEIMKLQLSDTVKARILHADGTHHRRTGESRLRSQVEMYELAKRFVD